jgi:hypothetical protein
MMLNEPEDVKFHRVVHQNQPRHSIAMQDRPNLNFDPENEISFKIWKRKWDSWIYMMR